MMLSVSLGAFALTGSGDSASGALETVSPTLDLVSAVTEKSLSATFSEPMRTPGVTTPGNYAVSGSGVGTLGVNPDGISGGGPYTLSWTAGEMQDGATLTLTASGLQDLVGNPIEPAQNSASCAGLGIAPVFTNLAASPAQASAGETVTIAFTVSETLAANPVVTVNGHDATFASAAKTVTYTYTYIVAETDAIGMAEVSVSGTDLAGNSGSLSSSAALEIVESLAPLPLYAWPAGLALLAAGIVVLARKKRGLTQAKRSGDVPVPVFWFLIAAALLASSAAFAQAPTVSNVTFTQSPTATSTQVDIHYDLDAPNGPCAITVSLSKDGGADGYIHPVTSVTGDVAGVTTGTGKHIVWDIRADYPEESIPNARIRVTADDGVVQHTLTYLAGPNGSISGPTPQTVNHGANGAQVTAVADPHYHFVQWSDLSTQNPRTDTNVTTDITVTASFSIDRYDITCNVVGNGTCVADPAQVDYGATSDIIVTPGEGWHIVSVVDSEEGAKAGSYTTTPVTANRTVTATFAINTYDITCNVVGDGTCEANPATVEHGSTSDIVVTPAVGWHIVSVVDSEEGAKPGSYTTTPVTADRTVTATFAINTYTVTCSVVGNGTCEANPATVEHGSTSDIVVTPAVGWHIVSVVDSEEGAKPGSYTTTPVTGPRTVTATFAINTYTLTYTAGPNGSISGDTPQTVNYGGSGTQVTAVPDGGYAFSQWSDGVLTAARTDTNVMADISVTASFVVVALPPVVTSFAINSGAATTMPLGVTLDNTATNSPTDFMASESASFTGAVWQPYATAPSFTLSFGVGVRTVYFKARNGAGESGVVSDTIFIVPDTVSVAAGTFDMGRTSAGDDATYGGSDELPVHSVTLGAYQLGKGEVTNKEYCDVLNWALAQGYLYADSAGTPWAGSGNIYAGGTATSRYLIVGFASTYCNIQYSGGVFTSKTRVGLPGSTNYSMDTHPMVMVSWYGSVAFCNWLSQWQGLTPCYDMNTALWPLTVAPPTPGGYRLPTEAEWERAAAWDTTVPKHWIYSFMSDTNSGPGSNNRCNDYWYNGSVYAYVNPLGLTTTPYTSPVGWFNGVNVSPNGGVATVNSPSPVGAYDMSGNVWEWCHDWYSSAYYGGGSMTNPTGPATGSYRVYRGGSWSYYFDACRSASRNGDTPADTDSYIGFRLARS